MRQLAPVNNAEIRQYFEDGYFTNNLLATINRKNIWPAFYSYIFAN